MDRPQDFWAWQIRALGALLAWGAGSIVVGGGLLASKQPAIRQAGLQALGWGAIDAALAWNGRRGARAKRHSETERAHVAAAARSFGLITAVNAALDVGYVAGGLWFASRNKAGSGRRGAGLSAAVQGLFLLVFDLYLTWRARSWQAN